MKKIGYICVALALLGGIPQNPAWAGGWHHHHYGGGVGLGLTLGVLGGWGLGYYGRPYYGYPPPAYGYGGFAPYGYGYAPAYGYPPVLSVPAAPPVVVQQQPQVVQTPPPAPPVNYWHYCRNPDGYYPYVKSCPGGWLQVAPQPAQ